MGSEAASLLPRLAGANVLCIGDVMLDRFIHGSASRISPEAPVPVVHVKKRVLIPGGVGNVVKNLAEWRVNPLTVSVVGDDANADALTKFLSFGNGNAGDVALIRDPARPTIVKTRIIAGIQQVVRYDEEELTPLSDETTDKLLAAAEKLLPRAQSVALSDYGKGVANPRLCRELIDMAAKRNIPVAVDPKGYDYAKYAGAYLVKPNKKELGEAVGAPIETDGQAVAAARTLMRTHNIQNILVTLSERGMLLLCGADGADAEPIWLPSKAREVFDVTGAGDTVLAGMTAALAVGAPLPLGARLATLAAGVVVGKVGTATASPEEIRRAAQLENAEEGNV